MSVVEASCLVSNPPAPSTGLRWFSHPLLLRPHHLHIVSKEGPSNDCQCGLESHTIADDIFGVQVSVKVDGVNNSDHSVQLGDVREALSVRALKGEGLSHLQGLRDTLQCETSNQIAQEVADIYRRFNDEIVETVFEGKLGDLDEQVLSECAADATVLHLHLACKRFGSIRRSH